MCYSPESVEWYKDNTRVPGVNGSTSLHLYTAAFQFLNVSWLAQVQGYYHCTARRHDVSTDAIRSQHVLVTLTGDFALTYIKSALCCLHNH